MIEIEFKRGPDSFGIALFYGIFRYFENMSIRNFFLKIGFLDLNQTRMDRLVEEKDEEMIIWAFKNGLYNIRRSAVQYFSESSSAQAISILRTAINDETELVSQEAMSALEKHDPSSEIIHEIAEKRQFWINDHAYRESRRNREHRTFSVLTEPKERGSKKTLDNVRNMLKKPMIGGKWF